MFKNKEHGLHIWIIALIAAFFMPIAYERAKNMTFKFRYMLEIAVYGTLSIISLNKVATFLYFNF